LGNYAVTSIATSEPDTGRHPLDSPAWSALTGPQAHLAEVNGQAARYLPEVSGFSALADDSDERAWADLAQLAGPGAQVLLGGLVNLPPAGWEIVFHGDGVQMVDTTVPADTAAASGADSAAELLGADDVPEMLDLVARTQPGPFAPRTIEMGTYLGIRRGGALVAMAGERVHPPGWTEISAVCTDPAYRGQGMAGRLVRAVAAGIRARGETPFLHASAANTNAIRLYEALGFTVRRQTIFLVARVPARSY
jgi:ribosomal protein S18 acetylase RimI-like enzyme